MGVLTGNKITPGKTSVLGDVQRHMTLGALPTAKKATKAPEPPKPKSNLQKVGGVAQGVGTAVLEKYKHLSTGLAESAAYDTKAQKEARSSASASFDASSKLLIDATKRLKTETDPTKIQHLHKIIDFANNTLKQTSADQTARYKEVMAATDPKKGAADVAGIGLDVLSGGTYGTAARGARTAQLTRESKIAKDASKINTGRAIAEGAGTGAVLGGAASAVSQEGNSGKVDMKKLAAEAGLGGVLGALGGGLTARTTNKVVTKNAAKEAKMMQAVDESALKADANVTAGEKFAADTAPKNQKLLGTGAEYKQKRINEIDAQLEGLRTGKTDPNSYSSNPESLGSLKGEPAGNVKLKKDGTPYKNTKSGTFGDTKSSTVASSNDTATQARQLLKERKVLQNEVDGISTLSKKELGSPSLNVKDPKVAKAVDSELQAVDNSQTPAVFGDKQTKKINALTDYFRTPTKALQRIGLKDTAAKVETSFKNYREDLRDNLNTLKGWEKRTKNLPNGSSERIFKYLDGKSQRLSGEELKVADEMKVHLEQWADKLGLPKDARVSDYITHIFDGDPKNTTDATLASILDTKPTSKITNPFLKKRSGKEGYKQDAFLAMEAYMKKSTRKLHMDPALGVLADASKNVDDKTARYLIKLNHSIAMKPDKIEQFLNDAVSSIPGLGDQTQGATKAMRAWRNTVYRATLGLNVGSAMRNLTQGTNTFAELGTRDTVAGYSKLIRTFGDAAKNGESAWDELNHMGILDDAVHMQDREVTTLKNTLQKADKGLWAMFDTAERINRGAAYFGAKAKAMRKLNMSEEEAQNYARDIVGKTQFRFNDVETPLALRSQVAKTLGQFQSFNIKQAEFLGGTAKGALKGDKHEIAKALRWAAANIAMASTVGGLLGIKWTDAIPDFGAFRGVRSPLLTTAGNIKQVVTGKNQYGQETDRGKLTKDALKSQSTLVVPGGTQIKKSIEGVKAVSEGKSKTEAGKTRFLVDKTPGNTARAALFGQYNLDEGKKFFNQGNEPLSDTQTKIVDTRDPKQQQAYYDFFQGLAKTTDSKTNTGKKIREAQNNGDFAKAKRLANEHNQAVQRQLDQLSKSGNVPSDLVDYIHSTYKVNYDYYTKPQKKKAWQN